MQTRKHSQQWVLSPLLSEFPIAYNCLQFHKCIYYIPTTLTHILTWHSTCQLPEPPVPTSLLPYSAFPTFLSCFILWPTEFNEGLGCRSTQWRLVGSQCFLQTSEHRSHDSQDVSSSTPTTHCTKSTFLLGIFSVPSLPHTTHKAETRLFCLEQSSPATSHRKCPLAEGRLTCLLLLPPSPHKLVVLDIN